MNVTINLLDDSTRPKAPKIEGMSGRQHAHGKRLAMIHDLHLQQMAQVRQVMERIAAGEEEIEKLGPALSSMQMMMNYRAFGNLCGRECHALTFHHTSEDQVIFPALARGSDDLRNVIERLRAEHFVIHQLIEQMETRAIKVIDMLTPETFSRLRDTFEMLERIVKSHFRYEQEELEEAIGYWNAPM